MALTFEENIYGLSEGVFKACQFLGLKFPPTVPKEFQSSQEHVPSDYFGDNVTLGLVAAKKIMSEFRFSAQQFLAVYEDFSRHYFSQKCFKHTTTDLNVYFCDYMLFVVRQQGYFVSNYFAFEFYNKSFELRNKFITNSIRKQTQVIYNDYNFLPLTINKGNTNRFFADFLHRDWIDTGTCTFEEFKAFVDKHPRFFAKPLDGSSGKGAQIINLPKNADVKNAFELLKKARRILEEIVVQHKSLQEFCPYAVNTLRINTLVDSHNVVHILTANGRFGKVGSIIDNFHGGGYSVIVDPKTGIITSDAINGVHERVQKHPDTSKIFKGFQYPSWEKVCALVKKMAKMIPQLRHLGWDIAINTMGKPILIEVNGVHPDEELQQAPDDTGRLHLYEPFLTELVNYKMAQMKLLGYRVNNLPDFNSAYNTPSRKESRLKFAMTKLIPDCTSLMDLGCRKEKVVKSITPPHVLKYYPVDFQKHDDEVISCDFNDGEFPDVKADTCLCALTAEYVEQLPQFLANMCNAAQKQILMLCRPFSDSEIYNEYRWSHPFLTDFTEEFLINTVKQYRFLLNAQYPVPDNKAIILYDFRKI